MEAPAQDSLGIRQDRPILGAGRGRIVVLAVAVGAILPVLVLRRLGDAAIADWIASHAAATPDAWRWIALAGRPLPWIVAAVVGFGIASGMNWPNSARWTGMVLLAVLWAGLANIAASGEADGAATLGATVCTLVLWIPRAWPIWGAIGIVAAVGQVLTAGSRPSAVFVSALLGALGPVLIEFCWHAAAPEAYPVRGADWKG